MLHHCGALVLQPLFSQKAFVDGVAVLLVHQPQSSRANDALTGAADGHDGQARLLSLGQGAGVDRVGNLGGQHAGAAAAHALHLHQLHADLGGHGHSGLEQLRTGALGDAAGIEGELVHAHRVFSLLVAVFVLYLVENAADLLRTGPLLVLDGDLTLGEGL